MTRRLHAPLIAAALAATLTATAPVAVEAQTSQTLTTRDQQLRNLASGAALLGVLGLAIKGQRTGIGTSGHTDVDDRRDVDRDGDGWQDDDLDGDGWRDDWRLDHGGRHDDRHGHGQGPGWGNRPGWGNGGFPPGQAAGRTLPGACVHRYHPRTGDVYLLDADCLSHSFPGAERLPLSCATTILDDGRFISGFDPQCLRNAGYRIGDR